jgi:Flp pilus assembly protein TadD
LNLAVTLHHSLRDHAQALQRYREYLALTPRAADWESVNAIVRALQQESARAAAPPSQTNALATVSPSQPAAPKPEPQSSPSPATLTPPAAPPKPASPPPTQTVALVTPPRSTPAISTPAPPVVTASPPPAPTPTTGVDVTTNPPPGPARLDTPTEKRSVLSRMNPANLFRRDPKSEPRPTPLPGDRTIASPVVLADVSPSPAPTPTPAPEPATDVVPAKSKPIPRYTYLGPAKPAAGNRSEAERAFAQGAQAQQAGKLSEAIQSYRAATQADPAFFEAHYNLGLAAGQAGRLSQSLAAYEQALALQPDSADARYNFALGLKQGGYLVDAAKELERIVAGHPDNTRARIALANFYAQQLRQPARAREHYRKVLDLDPRHPQADAIRHWLVQNPG